MGGLIKLSFRPALEVLEDRSLPSATTTAALAPPALPTATALAVQQQLPPAQESAPGAAVTVLKQNETPAAVLGLPGARARGDFPGMWVPPNTAKAGVRYPPWWIGQFSWNPPRPGLTFKASFAWFEWGKKYEVSLEVRSNGPGQYGYTLWGSPVFKEGSAPPFGHPVMVSIAAYQDGRQIAIGYQWTFYVVSCCKTGEGDGVARAGQREAATAPTNSPTGTARELAVRDQGFAALAQQKARLDARRALQQFDPLAVGAASATTARGASAMPTEQLDAVFKEFTLDPTRAR